MADELEVVDNPGEHRFEVRLGDEVAFAEYEVRPHARTLVLPHTLVPPAFEGKGVASRLAEFAMAYARARQLQVIPTCEFMAGYIKRHPEHHDLVHRLYREKLGL